MTGTSDLSSAIMDWMFSYTKVGDQSSVLSTMTAERQAELARLGSPVSPVGNAETQSPSLWR